MLYRLHSNILIIGLLLIGFLAVMTAERSFCVMTYSTIFAFVSQQFLLIYFSNTKERKYTDRTLFFTVLIYSILLGAILMSVSYYYSGDTFMLTKLDAWFYYQEGMKTVNIGFFENAGRIMRKYPMDDWGALITSSFLLSIVPSKLFVNALYILSGAASVVMIYRIGNYFMPNEYAFEAALAYGTSSYMVTFHCTFLKESLFVFAIICAIYFFYEAAIAKKRVAYIGVLLGLAATAFFRPAVTAFLVVAMIAYYAISQRGSAISFFLMLITIVIVAVSFSFLGSQLERYTGGGNREAVIAESASANYSNSFNVFVSWLLAFFGPFPTLFPMQGIGPHTTNLYAAGLTYKLFLIIPFWTGAIYTFYKQNIKMIPIVVFILVEMMSTGHILASGELRKVLMHVPFMYTVSFYGLSLIENSKRLDRIKQWVALLGCALALGILFLWTVVRVKG